MLSLGWFIAGLMVGGFLGTLLLCCVIAGELAMLHDKIWSLRHQLDDAKNREVLGDRFDTGDLE